MEDNFQSDEKKINKKKDDIFSVYLAGMLTGFMLLLAIVFVVNIYKLFKEPYNVNDVGSSIGEEAGFDKIVKKQELFLKLLDLYYYYDMDIDALEEILCDGIVEATGDKYAAYYTTEEYAKILEDNSGKYCGIGVVVQKNTDTNEITVTKFLKGSSAEAAGMLVGDIIVKVNDQEVTDIGMSAAVDLIKGEEGTEVTLTVLRDDEFVELKMKRTVIDAESVTCEMIDEVLYVYIESFDDNTPEQFRNALNFGKANNAKGIIYDLRDNPGGSLVSVVDMLDMIVDEGLLVYVQDRAGNRTEHKADDDESLTLPMVCLVNERSASGAELFSGTLKDYDIATIVGKTTYGKGVVQTLRQLTDGSAIKFTTSKYFTGGGTDIDGVGVIPDVDVELNEDAIVNGVVIRELDEQYKTAMEELKKLMEK